MPPAARLEVRGKDKSRLRSWVRASGIRAGLAQRARIVLLAGEGLLNTEIATRVGVSRPTVIHWRDRYAEGGLGALEDRKRSGRPPRVDEAEVVVATLTPPPERLGVTHWSSRLLAAELGIGFATVSRIWRNWRLQPWRVETFKFSTDPELEAKVRDVVGLYLNPPQNAVVLCIDEKSQVQALQRTAPILPLRPGLPEKATHDYIRNGTTTLFAALEVATGKVVDTCLPRHRHQEFLRFLKQVAKAYPRRELHIVCDNYATHKHPTVKAWLTYDLVGAENSVTSCDLHVLVQKATETVASQRTNSRGGGRGSAAGGRLLIERSVGAVRVVVLDVLPKHCREVARSTDQEVVEAFAAQGADEAFGDGVRPRCSDRGAEDADVGAGEHGVEGGGELAVPVADQELELLGAVAEIQQEVAGLLSDPGAGGVGGDSGEVHAAAAVLDHDEDVVAAEEDVVDVREVHGEDRSGLRGQELSPGRPGPVRRGVDPGGLQDRPHGGGGDRVAEPDQLALDASIAPPRVLPGQPQH